MFTKRSRRPIVPQIVCISMLLWALYPLPEHDATAFDQPHYYDYSYGYFVLLRVVLCASCLSRLCGHYGLHPKRKKKPSTRRRENEW